MKTFSGADNVANVVRLGAMNMYLRGIGGDRCPIAETDSLARDPGRAMTPFSPIRRSAREAA